MPLPVERAQTNDEIAAVAQALCGGAVSAIDRCGGGGNNRVYRVESSRGRFALKSYRSAELDNRDRLAHEFDGLRFLKAYDAQANIPAALAVDRPARCALYEWIDGTPPAMHGAADVASLLRLLAVMHGARTSPGAATLPDAAEAVLRDSDLLAQIERRLDRLAAVSPDDPELHGFLHDDVIPELTRRAAGLRATGDDGVLAPQRRTLSPSDVGFHNALRRTDGSLVFIDFEYFGWDDPVKLTADFLWHPAMTLAADERRLFMAGAAELFGEPGFAERLALHFPLYGIRWVLIILNEFLPQIWARRSFAGKGGDWDAAKREQLRKARTKMADVRGYIEGQFVG